MSFPLVGFSCEELFHSEECKNGALGCPEVCMSMPFDLCQLCYSSTLLPAEGTHENLFLNQCGGHQSHHQNMSGRSSCLSGFSRREIQRLEWHEMIQQNAQSLKWEIKGDQVAMPKLGQYSAVLRVLSHGGHLQLHGRGGLFWLTMGDALRRRIQQEDTVCDKPRHDECGVSPWQTQSEPDPPYPQHRSRLSSRGYELARFLNNHPQLRIADDTLEDCAATTLGQGCQGSLLDWRSCCK
eukprot:s281_g12.t1